MGEVLQRVVAKVTCTQLKSDYSSHLSPVQHDVAVVGGAQMLTHHVQLALEANPD